MPHFCLVSCTAKVKDDAIQQHFQTSSGLSTALITHHLCSRASCAVALLSGSRVSRLLSRSKPASDSVRPSKSNLLTGNLLSRFGAQAGNLNCKTKQLVEAFKPPHKIQQMSNHAVHPGRLWVMQVRPAWGSYLCRESKFIEFKSMHDTFCVKLGQVNHSYLDDCYEKGRGSGQPWAAASYKYLNTCYLAGDHRAWVQEGGGAWG